MPEAFKPGWTPPGTSPTPQDIKTEEQQILLKKEERTMIQVGQKAPEFSLPAIY